MAETPLNLYKGEDHRPFVFEAAGERRVGALLIHGFMGTPKEMRALGRALAETGVTAHGILLPGFGADVATLGDRRAADWIAAATDAWRDLTARYRRTVLLGYSTGAAVGLHVAAKRPPDRLVLLAPYTRIADRRAAALPLLKRFRADLRPFEHADFHTPATREGFRLIDSSLDIDDPAIQARIRAESRIPLAALDELRWIAGHSRVVAKHAIAPTLVIQGSDDRVSLPRFTRRLLRSLGGVLTYHEVPCDHQLTVEERVAWPRIRDLVLGHVAPLVDRSRPPSNRRDE